MTFKPLNPIIITKIVSVDGFFDERDREIFDENDFVGMKAYLNQEDLDDDYTEDEIMNFLQGDTGETLEFDLYDDPEEVWGYFTATRYKTVRQQLLDEYINKTHDLDDSAEKILEK